MPTLVANSAAQISGKKILLADAAETITALHTYSRGAAVPFAVATGALRVPNLIAGGDESVVALGDVAAPALDASLGRTFKLTATGNRTIAVPSNAVDGQRIIIAHVASGGARTLALNTGAGGFRFGSDITALTATASGKTDYIGAIYNGTDSKWDVVAVTKGF